MNILYLLHGNFFIGVTVIINRMSTFTGINYSIPHITHTELQRKIYSGPDLDIFLGTYCFQHNLHFHISRDSSIDISLSGVNRFFTALQINGLVSIW